MEIVTGKKYKTRRGCVVEIIAIDQRLKKPAIGIVEFKGDEAEPDHYEVFDWLLDGFGSYRHQSIMSDFDLVEEVL
jgi:hypothetical protein